MRFTHLRRLMVVGEYISLNTLDLFQRYAAAWEEYEHVVYTRKRRFYTSSRLGKWKEKKYAELNPRLDAVEAEVTSRYERLLKLMCLRAAVTNEEQYRAAVIAIWTAVRDTWAEEMAFMPRDHREFPKWFWRACEQNLPGHISPLRGKFMLRPFVDELPDRRKRDVLLSSAYGVRTQPPIGRAEFDEGLEPACLLLHQQLLQRGADVSVLTDDVLSPAVLEGVTSPLEFYTKLLFP